MIRCSLPGRGIALFTERADGNLSTMRGDGHEHGVAARDRLREQLGLALLFAGAQVHGSSVRRTSSESVGDSAAAPASADGQATSLDAAGVMVLTADCLPVMLGSEHAVAAIHAGWRGLAAGVLEEGVRAVRELAAQHAPRRAAQAEIAAIIGPGAGACCYEVGPEVHAALAAARPPGDGVCAAAHDRGAAPIDLKAIARERLLAAGVRTVRDVELCTICDARFFSHRREADRAGRQAGVAWLS